jgi:hypothetical protein
MYSGITKICDRKTKGPTLMEMFTATKKKLTTAAVKNIDAAMLTRVWKELEYRIDVCRVTRGAHIEHL